MVAAINVFYCHAPHWPHLSQFPRLACAPSSVRKSGGDRGGCVATTKMKMQLLVYNAVLQDRSATQP